MNIVIHTKTGCIFCDRAKRWLNVHGFEYQIILHDNDIERHQFYKSCGSAVYSVPQIFIDDKRIGGYTELLNSGIEHKNQISFDSEF